LSLVGSFTTLTEKGAICTFGAGDPDRELFPELCWNTVTTVLVTTGIFSGVTLEYSIFKVQPSTLKRRFSLFPELRWNRVFFPALCWNIPIFGYKNLRTVLAVLFFNSLHLGIPWLILPPIGPQCKLLAL
jgi:hypothetical protein